MIGIKNGDSVILYGAGVIGHHVHKILQKRGVNVLMFMDAKANPSFRKDGVLVVHPSTQKPIRDVPLLITTLNPRVSLPFVSSLDELNRYADVAKGNDHATAEDLRKHLISLGWETVIPFDEIYMDIGTDPERTLWLGPWTLYNDVQTEIYELTGLMQDQISRRTLHHNLIMRNTGRTNHMDGPLPDQYFTGTVPSWKQPIRLLDCGAYDGDTIRFMKSKGIAFQHVMAFEPDPANLMKLEQLAQEDDRIMVSNLGLWSHNCAKGFKAGDGLGCGISDNANTIIECVAIDSLCLSPTLIKMDIEGAELEAIKGAEQTIRKHRPGLAICLYHEPEHLWQIPLLIHSLDLGYRFYLRSHAYSGFELVIYAIQP